MVVLNPLPHGKFWPSLGGYGYFWNCTSVFSFKVFGLGVSQKITPLYTCWQCYICTLCHSGYRHQTCIHQDWHSTYWRGDTRKVPIYKGTICYHVHKSTLDHPSGKDPVRELWGNNSSKEQYVQVGQCYIFQHCTLEVRDVYRWQ